MKTKALKRWIILGASLVLICLIPTCFMRCTKVDTSEVGIKFNKLSLTDQGKLDAMTVTGYVFYCPITTDVYTYETRVRQCDYDTLIVQTKDGTKFNMDPLLNYRIIRERAIDVFSKYRMPLDYIEGSYMKTAIYDAYRINANKYTADELIANRAKFEDDVKAMLETTLDGDGFHVEQFTSQIDPPKSLSDKIDAKNAAVQEALKKENEIQAAKAKAQIAVAKAEGEAKAMKIKADAEAYYNRTIAASLSPMIVQEDWIEKWDGQLPTFTGGTGSIPMINFKMGE
jgi:regulator of protease activity HflC (stomatin/prohibitin superfamily)